MKMKFFLITCILLLVVQTSGCINPYDPYKYTKDGTYHAPELALKFNYPVDWEIEKSYLYEKGLIKILRLEKNEDFIEVYILPRNYTSNLSEIFEIISLGVKEIEYSYLKEMTTEEILNKTWVKSLIEYYDYYIVYILGTICPDYDFVIGFHSESNDTEPLYQIAESLQCGETNATIP